MAKQECNCIGIPLLAWSFSVIGLQEAVNSSATIGMDAVHGATLRYVSHLRWSMIRVHYLPYPLGIDCPWSQARGGSGSLSPDHPKALVRPTIGDTRAISP